MFNTTVSNKSWFARYAWSVVAFNVLVIVWGAFVRASKSGDGCGSHWPFCNGETIPIAPTIKTIIEFSHRLTSGIALLLVIGLVIWAFRRYKGLHLVRQGTVFSLVFILIEAMIGARIVLFGLVADNSSMSRAFWLSVHLVNTMILVLFLTLTAYWASGGKPFVLRGNARTLGLFAVTLVGMLLVGVSGATAALGDTLFPVNSLAEGLAQDFSPTAHFLIWLRVWHPFLSAIIGGYTIALAVYLRATRSSESVRFWATTTVAAIVLQIALGGLNVLLLAPVWMQLVHLFAADLLWIALVLLTASALAESTADETKLLPLKTQTAELARG